MLELTEGDELAEGVGLIISRKVHGAGEEQARVAGEARAAGGVGRRPMPAQTARAARV